MTRASRDPRDELREIQAELRALGVDIGPVPPEPPAGVDPIALARMMRDPVALPLSDLLTVMRGRLPELIDDAERAEGRSLDCTIFGCFNVHAASGELAFRLALGPGSEREIRLRIAHGHAFARASGAPWTFHVTGGCPQYMRTLLSFVEEHRRREVEAWAARLAPPNHVHVILISGEQSSTHWLEIVRTSGRVTAVRDADGMTDRRPSLRVVRGPKKPRTNGSGVE